MKIVEGKNLLHRRFSTHCIIIDIDIEFGQFLGGNDGFVIRMKEKSQKLGRGGGGGEKTRNVKNNIKKLNLLGVSFFNLV